MTLNEARQVAVNLITEMYTHDSADVVIQDNETIVDELGWVFFYNSRSYVETQDVSKVLLGNFPIFVEKANGAAHPMHFPLNVHDWLQAFKKGAHNFRREARKP